jgi:hypothetical protein
VWSITNAAKSVEERVAGKVENDQISEGKVSNTIATCLIFFVLILFVPYK